MFFKWVETTNQIYIFLAPGKMSNLTHGIFPLDAATQALLEQLREDEARKEAQEERFRRLFPGRKPHLFWHWMFYTPGRLLGGGFKYFLFSPLLGENSHFD